MKAVIREHLEEDQHLPRTRIEKLLGVHREASLLEALPQKGTTGDVKILVELNDLIATISGSGYRKFAHETAKKLKIAINHKRIYRIMKAHNLLHPKCRHFRVQTTDSNHSSPIYPNLAAEIIPSAIDQLWVGDITYIALKGKRFVYLATVMDAFSRRVIGYSIEAHMRVDLCLEAMNMAIRTRKLAEGKAKDLVFHSDRGSQYASEDHRAKLAHYGINGSMSRKGNCYDNAKAESLNRTIKVEHVYRMEYSSLQAVRQGVSHFLDVTYNQLRPHTALRYWSPAHFEQNLLVEQKVS